MACREGRYRGAKVFGGVRAGGLLSGVGASVLQVSDR